MHPSITIPVLDKSHAGEARRLARVWAREAGGTEDHGERVALVVTELANNLHLHTSRGGVLLLRKLTSGERVGVEVLSLDEGPGSANFGAFLRDGFSTAGTPGTGLGAVKRASQVFEVHSQPGVGTALLSQVWPKGAARAEETWLDGAVNLPKRGETISGDSWCFCDRNPRRARLILADGLGHGPLAAEASQRAVNTFYAEHRGRTLPELVETLHAALRHTRGAAVGVAEIVPAEGSLRYVGVGNIAASVLTDAGSTSLVSMNGTVGLQCQTLREFRYAWSADAVLAMSSDGLKTQWNVNRYPGLIRRHPALIAGVLYRDHNRGTDDTTVVAIRIPA